MLFPLNRDPAVWMARERQRELIGEGRMAARRQPPAQAAGGNTAVRSKAWPAPPPWAAERMATAGCAAVTNGTSTSHEMHRGRHYHRDMHDVPTCDSSGCAELFRHLREEHKVGEKLSAAQTENFDQED
jgi:hypothetical protein